MLQEQDRLAKKDRTKLNNILTPYAHADGFLMIEKDKVNSKGNNGGNWKQKRPHKK